MCPWLARAGPLSSVMFLSLEMHHINFNKLCPMSPQTISILYPSPRSPSSNPMKGARWKMHLMCQLNQVIATKHFSKSFCIRHCIVLVSKLLGQSLISAIMAVTSIFPEHHFSCVSCYPIIGGSMLGSDLSRGGI